MTHPSQEEKRRRWRESYKRRSVHPEFKAKAIARTARYRKAHPEKYSYEARKGAAKRWRCLRPELRLSAQARHRAKKKGMEFTIVASDVLIPKFCPVLDIPLDIGGDGSGNPLAPSIDRLDSTKGYTPENVCIISRRANTLKNNATVAELERVLAYMKEQGCP